MVVYRHVDIPDEPGRIGLDGAMGESGSRGGTGRRCRLPVPEPVMPADVPDIRWLPGVMDVINSRREPSNENTQNPGGGGQQPGGTGAGGKRPEPRRRRCRRGDGDPGDPYRGPAGGGQRHARRLVHGRRDPLAKPRGGRSGPRTRSGMPAGRWRNGSGGNSAGCNGKGTPSR